MKINLTPDENLILTTLANAQLVEIELHRAMNNYFLFKFRVTLEIDGTPTVILFSYSNNNGGFLNMSRLSLDLVKECAQMGFYPEVFVELIPKALPEFYTSYIELFKAEVDAVPTANQFLFKMNGVLNKLTSRVMIYES